MTVGLVGSHRTGKTTLAEAVSLETGLPLVLTSTSEVFRSLGISPRDKLDFGERMMVQNKVLDAGIEAWNGEDAAFITDRTPMDMLGYTMADVASGGEEHLREQAFQNYTDRCFEACNSFFSTLVLIQPGIPLIEDASKVTAALNRPYMEHLNSLMLGLIYDERCGATAMYIRRDVVNMDARTRAVIYAMESALERAIALTSGQQLH